MPFAQDPTFPDNDRSLGMIGNSAAMLSGVTCAKLAKISCTAVGSSTGSPEPLLRPSPAIGHDSVDLFRMVVGRL
jgi:hypothetical protein